MSPVESSPLRYSPAIAEQIVATVTGILPDDTPLRDVFAQVYDTPVGDLFVAQDGVPPARIQRNLLDDVKGLMKAGFTNIGDIRAIEPGDLLNRFNERHRGAKLTMERAGFLIQAFAKPEPGSSS